MLAETTVRKSFVVEHKAEPICSQCQEYDRGVCRLRAAADWGDASFVKPDKKACHFASILPF